MVRLWFRLASVKASKQPGSNNSINDFFFIFMNTTCHYKYDKLESFLEHTIIMAISQWKCKKNQQQQHTSGGKLAYKLGFIVFGTGDKRCCVRRDVKKKCQKHFPVTTLMSGDITATILVHTSSYDNSFSVKHMSAQKALKKVSQRRRGERMLNITSFHMEGVFFSTNRPAFLLFFFFLTLINVLIAGARSHYCTILLMSLMLKA